MRLAYLCAPVLLAGLAACEPQANLQPTGTAALSGASCDATLYADLVGEPIAVVDTLNTGLSVRVLAADAFVTRDFDPNRLTFTTTPADKVGRVFCG